MVESRYAWLGSNTHTLWVTACADYPLSALVWSLVVAQIVRGRRYIIAAFLHIDESENGTDDECDGGALGAAEAMAAPRRPSALGSLFAAKRARLDAEATPNAAVGGADLQVEPEGDGGAGFAFNF